MSLAQVNCWEDAVAEDPECRGYCTVCGEKNNDWDDVGFFYHHLDGKYVPICFKCKEPNTCER